MSFGINAMILYREAVTTSSPTLAPHAGCPRGDPACRSAATLGTGP